MEGAVLRPHPPPPRRFPGDLLGTDPGGVKQALSPKTKTVQASLHVRGESEDVHQVDLSPRKLGLWPAAMTTAEKGGEKHNSTTSGNSAVGGDQQLTGSNTLRSPIKPTLVMPSHHMAAAQEQQGGGERTGSGVLPPRHGADSQGLAASGEGTEAVINAPKSVLPKAGLLGVMAHADKDIAEESMRRRVKARERVEKRRMETVARAVMLIQKRLRGSHQRLKLRREAETNAAIQVQRVLRGGLARDSVHSKRLDVRPERDLSVAGMTRRTRRDSHTGTHLNAEPTGQLDEYMERKRINELMAFVARSLVIDRPGNHVAYMTSVLARSLDLVRAAKAGSVAEVVDLLEAGVYVDGVVEAGMTPLLWACKLGHTPVVELLVGKRASLTLTDDSGSNALWYACEGGFALAAAVLLAAGADPNFSRTTNVIVHDDEEEGDGGGSECDAAETILEDESHETYTLFEDTSATIFDSTVEHPHTRAVGGVTCAMLAAELGHFNVLERLAARAANLGLQNSDGATAAFLAAESGHEDCVRLLYRQGADMTTRTNDDWSPMLIAAQQGHVGVLRCLTECGVSVQEAWSDGSTALHMSAQSGHVDCVRFLADRGAVLDARAQDGATPLFVAAHANHSMVVAFLANHEASLDIARSDGTTALITAAGADMLAMVRLLCRVGADVNKAWNDGATPLYIASQLGHFEVVQYLLSLPTIAPNLPMKDGTSPLWIACERGFRGIAQILLEAGADPHIVDTQQWTPLMAAVQQGHTDIVELLAEAGANLNQRAENGATAAYLATVQNHCAVMQQLIRHGASVTLPKTNGWTPLYIAKQKQLNEMVGLIEGSIANNEALVRAAMDGRADDVEEFLRLGVDVDFSDDAILGGCTALAIAATEGHLSVVKLLVRAGARIEAGSFPAAWMAARAANDEILRYLIVHGADLNFPTCDGRTPLLAAALEGHLDTMELLCHAHTLAPGSTTAATTSTNAREAYTKPSTVDGTKADETRPVEEAVVESATATETETSPTGKTRGDTSTAAQRINIKPKGSERKGVKSAIVPADPNLTDSDGASPLLVVANRGLTRAVEAFLDLGADPNISEYSTLLSPLHLACQNHHTDTVRVLCGSPTIDVNCRAADGQTPLFAAAMRGYYDVVQILADTGADVNVPDKESYTPLMVAAKHNYFQAVDSLARLGVDVDQKRPNGSNAVWLAVQGSCTEVLNVLQKHGADMKAMSAGLQN